MEFRLPGSSSLRLVRVHVALFAGLRERAGTDGLDLELPAGSQVADALERLRDLAGDVPVVMAVNHEYAEAGTELRAGDELALIPPVSGGAGATMHVRVTDEPLALAALLDRVRDPGAGAIVTFSGVTRAVDELDYEAYVPMAESKISQILAAATARHGLCSAVAEHRIGRVALSEPSVLVAVSAPHRAEAFAGAREIIDEIKAQVPIWKKEGGEWVKGTTPG